MIISIVNLKTLLLTVATNVMAEASGNPLLADFDTPFATPPFDRIRLEHYEPAFEAAIHMERREIDRIVANPEAPTFENTVEALEFVGRKFSAIHRTFNLTSSVETSDSLQLIARRLQPKLTARLNNIVLNEKLFERVKEVYDRRDLLTLAIDQRALLEQSYRQFIDRGVNLNAADKERYRAMSSELGNLTLRFGQNILLASNSMILSIPAIEGWRVKDMPDFAIESMAQRACEDGETGWKVPMWQTNYLSFMACCADRELRRELWNRMNTRCLGGEYDNSATIKRIVELRLQIANLMGYKDYASFVLERRMAGNEKAVNAFLEQLLHATRDKAREEFDIIKAYAAQNGGPTDFAPWDWTYYSERYRAEHYGIGQNLLKPYFRLENALSGAFLLGHKLYGLKFKESGRIPVWNPAVKAYEVRDGNGRFLAVIYFDFYPRKSKRPGAWTTSLRDLSIDPQTRRETRPLMVVCCNFQRPTSDIPSLLSLAECRTLFHEFGHALHGVLGEGRYPSVSTSYVDRDFVELPSQIMENWATEKEFLDLWAVHYQTGKKMPRELIAKVVAASNCQAAYQNVRQVMFGMTDMAWHTVTGPVGASVEQFERDVTRPVSQFYPGNIDSCFSPSFSHIFSDGYAAGYYGYKWAEMLDADAFSLFRKNGIFDRKTAEAFRRNILAPGATEDPMTLYVRFRGHRPDIGPMLERMGVRKPS